MLVCTIIVIGEDCAKGTLKKSCLPPSGKLLIVISFRVDYAKLIWEDLIHKLNKKTRENIVLYPRHNWALKPNQTEGPPFTDHMKAICKLDVPTKASKSKTGQSEIETKSSSTKDKSLSHPSPPTPMVSEMHKEAQQEAGGPTSLGATSEEGAHPQLSSGHDASADSTAEADLGLSAPNDSISS
ncbi:hypothetical protein Tco_0692033 [Tanacetum coccineum]